MARSRPRSVPGEHGDPLARLGPERRNEPSGDAPRIGHALDEHRDRAARVRKGSVPDAPDALCRGRRLDEARGLAGVQSPAHRRAREVGSGEAEHRLPRGAGRRQRHGAELAVALKLRDGAQQRGERWCEVRLVEQHHGVVPEEPRVHRATRAPVAVAREQEPRTHHVHGADEHRGPGRVEAPRAVVGEPPAQHSEPDRMLGGMGRTGIERAGKGGERGDAHRPGAHDIGRLVDDGAAVDDVDDAPRQGRARKRARSASSTQAVLPSPVGMSIASGTAPRTSAV